jgi:NAD+ kinase
VRALDRVGLLVALHKAGVNEAIKQLVALLESSGVEVVMPKEVADLLGRPNFASVEDLGKVDVLIALGGDGCVLSAARIAAPNNVPILGIRIGGFGFLAEVELEHVEEALKKLFAKDFWLDERTMLQAELWHSDILVWSAAGLNDVVTLKSPTSPLPVWEVFVNDEFLARYPADGVAVATPTGSTAYTLSAGGPVLAPDVDAFLLMPMYAHTLTLRPLVLPSKAKVTIQLLPQRRPVEGEVSVDGQLSHQVLPTHRLVIFKAPTKAKIVRFHGSSFYERLRQKLRWGERQ